MIANLEKDKNQNVSAVLKPPKVSVSTSTDFIIPNMKATTPRCINMGKTIHKSSLNMNSTADYKVIPADTP